LDDFLAKIN